ncbi:septum formation family protein [Parafrankia discariae]|uniref:septum formation family protein n=1 Tax=Parafrankia discariae TaxID=365528 RepID=UPI0003A75744|nr:septum formation family protein [Parafrankia discariae]
MPGDSAPTPNGDGPDPMSAAGPFGDPFADLVLDEAFIAGATRYEAPTRTRAALARFGLLEDSTTPWRSYGADRPRRAGGTSGQPLTHRRTFRPFPEISPPPRSRARSRARIVLALLSVVLFATTVYGFVASAGDSPPSTTLSSGPPPAAGSGSGRDAAAAAVAGESLPDLHRRDWTAGHCYTWLQPDAGSAVDDVPCADRHLFEVVGPLDVGSTYPGGEPYPSPAQWHALGEWHCEPLVTAYLGYGLDPAGRFAMNILRPGEREWNTGERDIVCGLSLRPAPEAPNEVPDLEGQVRGADQART